LGKAIDELYPDVQRWNQLEFPSIKPSQSSVVMMPGLSHPEFDDFAPRRFSFAFGHCPQDRIVRLIAGVA